MRSVVYSDIGRGRPCADSFNFVRAARNEGAHGEFIDATASGVASNAARDILGKAMTELKLNTVITPYYVNDVTVASTDGTVKKTAWPILLPHELWAALCILRPQRFSELFGDPTRRQA